jgi:DNA-binding response OmpR family regulator
LVVEDDPKTALWLCSVLHADGFRTARADSAERAWMMVRKLWPSVVLLDHALPVRRRAFEAAGSELARHLAEHRPTASLPVIMLSGHDLVALEGDAALPRQTTVLRKPVNREALLAELWRQEATNRRRSLRVLLAHQDPELLRFAQRVLSASHFLVSIEPNNHTFLETLEAQPRLFDVVLLEPCAEPGDTRVLLRGFAALEVPPPLVVIADLAVAVGPDADALHEWPVLRLFSKSEVLSEPGALLERLLEIGRPVGRAARDSEAAAA